MKTLKALCVLAAISEPLSFKNITREITISGVLRPSRVHRMYIQNSLYNPITISLLYGDNERNAGPMNPQ